MNRPRSLGAWRARLEICVLASGSSGNAVYVGTRGGGVLIDAGLAAREVERRLAAVGIDPGSVRALVLTHEHRDHCSGLGVFARRFGVPAYLAAGVEREVERTLGPGALKRVEVRNFEAGEVFEAAGLSFSPFATSHDAAYSVGFRVTDGAATFGLATDLGESSPMVVEMLRGADALCLESNHDVKMLKNGPYPAFLKARIGSEKGHLSNDQCAGLLGELLHGGLKTLVLAHLSETNNHPRLAFGRALGLLKDRGAAEDVTLLVGRQDKPGTLMSI